MTKSLNSPKEKQIPSQLLKHPLLGGWSSMISSMFLSNGGRRTTSQHLMLKQVWRKRVSTVYAPQAVRL